LILLALVGAGLAQLLWGQLKQDRVAPALGVDNLPFNMAPLDSSRASWNGPGASWIL